MMLNLEKINQLRSQWPREPISINSDFIVSIEPLAGVEITEVNLRVVNPSEHYTTVTYRQGATTKTIVVANKYSDILSTLNQRKVLLNG